jgi:hypothetical protein
MLALLAGAAMGAGVASAQTADNSALERELLADAGSRASFQAGGTAGHDGSSFFLGSADGNYRLEIGGYTQFRYTLNFRDTDDEGGEGEEDEDFTNGFDMTTAALEFGGNVINPQLSYYIRGYFDSVPEGEEDSGDGSFDLADAYGSYAFDNGVSLTWGQFLTPVIRERLVDERYQLAAARSILAEVFSPEYTQGLALSGTSDNFRWIGSFNDGANTSNTTYYSPIESDYGLTGRVEFKWSGDWDQFQDLTSWRGTEGYAGMIGGAVHWEDGGDTGAIPGGTTIDASNLLYTLDASVEGNGWNVFASFIGNTFEPEGGEETDNYGFSVQGGFFVSEQAEIFARWESIFPDDDLGGDEGDADDMNAITAGVNYYFVAGSHAAKFTGDVLYMLDDMGDVPFGLPDASTGALTDSEDQFAIRLQMQLVF